MALEHRKVKLKADIYNIFIGLTGIILAAPGYFYGDFVSKPFLIKLAFFIGIVSAIGFLFLTRYLWLVLQDLYDLIIENNSMLTKIVDDVSKFNKFTVNFYKNFTPNSSNPPSPLNAKMISDKVMIECRGKTKEKMILGLFRTESQNGDLVGTFVVLAIDGDYFKAIEAEIADKSWAENIKNQEINLSSYVLIPVSEES